jgi:hypothetical protein
LKPSQNKKKEIKPEEIQMNRNLNSLRQNYCRPATVTGKKIHYLFPLEQECDEGKALIAKTPVPVFHLQEFEPSGLEQTYRDEATGADLPVFAVFDLYGDHQLTFEITAEFVPTTAEPGSLRAHIPMKETQAFVKQINERRIRTEPAVTRIALVLGILPALAYLFFHSMVMTGRTFGFVLTGCALGAFFAYTLSRFVLDQLWPLKKLVITAEFDGILPKEAREKARAAEEQFNNLYLIVDQQHHWKSALLPDPSSRVLDPLLIGELKEDNRRKFFVIHQFDLTEAEQCLTDEFATMPE